MKKIIAIVLTASLLVLNTSPITNAVENNQNEQTENSERSNNRKKTDDPAPYPSETPRVPDEDNDTEVSVEDEKENEDTDNSDKNQNSDTNDRKSEEVSESSPNVLSDSAILINADTGKVIYEKEAHTKRYPASTTKIMTAYIVLNKLDLNMEVTASKEAVSIPSDSSKMNLVEGETLTVKDLLYAMMVQSANDAANVLAETVAGSIPEFVNLMNQTAQELGMTNTLFANPHGYHVSDHYTTAYDMSLLAQKAMENELFREIVSTKKYTIGPTNKTETERVFVSRNMLISNIAKIELRYSYADGIKTGYTDAAGQCLVASAVKGGMRLITVTFHAPKNNAERAYYDTKSMFEYGYKKYSVKTVLKSDALASTCEVKWASGKSHLTLKTDRDIKALLPKENYNEQLLTSEITLREDITAPIKNGEELGEVKYYYNGEEVACAKLYATRDISRSYIKQVLSYLLNPWFLTILGLIVVFLLLQLRKEKRRVARARRARKRKMKG